MHTLLIDHDNIDYSRVTVRRLLEAWIDAEPELQKSGPPRILRIRAYGGWYSKSFSSEARSRAADVYTEGAPSLLKRGGNYYSISFEFADTLASSRSVRITHTVVNRGSPSPAVKSIRGAVCPEANCELLATKRWLRKKRACGREACPRTFTDHFERIEQKQVDVHLALDLVTILTMSSGCVAVVTDDADILPAALVATENGTAQSRLTLIRRDSHQTYADPHLRSNNVRIAILAT